MTFNITPEILVMINLIFLFILKIIVFILGYLTIRVGANLLREGIKGDFKFNAGFSGAKADLQSGSPGLLFTLLGIILIGFAMAYNKEIPYEKEIIKKHIGADKKAIDSTSVTKSAKSGAGNSTENTDPIGDFDNSH
jgi:hypothetical protein